MPLDSTIAAVTDRIRERSRATRQRYRDRVARAHAEGTRRAHLSCGNQAHAYAAMGDEFTAGAEAGMQGWVDDNPQDKFGRHEYKLAQYGLSVEKLAPMFERYLAEYDVEREG